MTSCLVLYAWWNSVRVWHPRHRKSVSNHNSYAVGFSQWTTKIMNYGLTHLMVRIYKFVWIYRIIYIVWCLVLFCTCDETWHDTQDVSSILWFQFSMCKHPQYVSVFYCVSFRPTRAQREELPFSVSKKRPLKIMKMMIRMLKSVMLLQGHTTTEMMLPPWRITSIC